MNNVLFVNATIVFSENLFLVLLCVFALKEKYNFSKDDI